MSGHRPRVFCRQCGGSRSFGSASRCRKCYLGNAAERRNIDDDLGQLRVLLRQMECQLLIHESPGDLWKIGMHPEQINGWQAWYLSEAIR